MKIKKSLKTDKPVRFSLPKKQEVNSGLTAIRHLNRSTDPFNKEAITGPVEMWWFEK
jgi:hypothetical protein